MKIVKIVVASSIFLAWMSPFAYVVHAQQPDATYRTNLLALIHQILKTIHDTLPTLATIIGDSDIEEVQPVPTPTYQKLPQDTSISSVGLPTTLPAPSTQSLPSLTNTLSIPQSFDELISKIRRSGTASDAR